MGQHDRASFVHQASIYSSDEQFLAMAVPFVKDGLARAEPVLVTTTSANLALLWEAVGPDWQQFDHAESAYFGRRTAQRVAAFDRYWKRRSSGGDGHVRILAEPVWPGRSDGEITAWTRMESTLNVVLSTTNIWMICPYDTRLTPAAVVTDAQRTHPTRMDGHTTLPCPQFVDPATFTRACDAAPLPGPPPHTAQHGPGRDLAGMRRFVAVQAGTLGLASERVQMLVAAANEAAAYLLNHGSGGVVTRIWTRAGTLVCDLRQPAGNLADPFLGFRPPGSQPADDDGLWLARQLCDTVKAHTDDNGVALRLQVPGPHAQEPLQTAAVNLLPPVGAASWELTQRYRRTAVL
jgi:hypothetical protein